MPISTTHTLTISQDFSRYPKYIYLINMNPLNIKLKNRIKQFPGIFWDSQIRKWICPKDLLSIITKIALKEKYTIVIPGSEGPFKPTYEELIKRFSYSQNENQLNKKLLYYQKEGIQKTIDAGAQLLHYGTGVGKTATALTILQLLNPFNALICCPSGVRNTWIVQMQEWYTGSLKIHLLEGKKDFEKLNLKDPLTSGIFLTSYDLLKYLIHKSFDLIIWDELHYLQNIKSNRTKTALKISNNSPLAYRIGLTATPFHNEVESLYSQINLLRPNTFGDLNIPTTYYKYKKRYCAKVDCEHAKSGYTFEGLSPIHKKELRYRIKQFTHTVKKSEIAHLLPKEIIKPIFIKASLRYNDRKLFEELSSGKKDQHKLDAAVLKNNKGKLKHIISYTLDKLGEEAPITLLSYHRDHNKKTADALTKALKNTKYKHKKIITMDGDTPHREKVIKQAIKDDAILCTTMGAIREGLNTLIYYRLIIFAELYWDAVKTQQVMGRFPRLNSDPNKQVTFIFFIKQKTIDEIIMSVLRRRLTEDNKIFGSKDTKHTIMQSFDQNENQIMDDLMLATSSMIEDGYL